MYLLGIDLGTSSIKAAIFGIDGRFLAHVNREYLQIPEGETYVEIDGEAYWQATAAVIREVVAASGLPAREIRALSISSHGETLFLVDEAGRPVRPAILTIDARATEEAAALVASPGRAAIYDLTGQPDVLPIWPAAKIAWLCKHEPDVVARTRRFLLPQGYVISRFCGRPADDPSVLATSLLFDIWQRAWSPALVAASGIEIDRLAEVLAPGSVAGTVSPAAAAETGLDPGTLVVTGALDQVCAAIAAGNIRPGVLTESTGSVLALLVTAPQELRWKASLRDSGLPVYPHAVPGLYCLLPWHQTGGLALKWFRDRFGAGPVNEDFDALTQAAAQVEPGSDGLVVLPHLEGAQFPESVPGARGVFFGVALHHGRGHFVRAILEAVACLIARDVAALRAAAIPVQSIVSLGGGARSDLWLQIKADICDLPVATLESEEAALLGAAMLAGVGAGCFADLPAAVRAMSRPGRQFLPNAAHRMTYDRTLATYTVLHERLLDLF